MSATNSNAIADRIFKILRASTLTGKHWRNKTQYGLLWWILKLALSMSDAMLFQLERSLTIVILIALHAGFNLLGNFQWHETGPWCSGNISILPHGDSCINDIEGEYSRKVGGCVQMVGGRVDNIFYEQSTVKICRQSHCVHPACLFNGMEFHR